MSELELSDSYDPDVFKRPSRTPAAAVGPPPTSREDALPPPAPAAAPPRSDGDPVPWKAAASSVPKLRQQPAAREPESPGDAFPGFAQDAPLDRGPARFGGLPGLESDVGAGSEPAGRALPLSVEPPFMEVWLERARALPPPFALGLGALLLTAALLPVVLRPRDQAGVSLAAIRQHPEAYDGRVVSVRGSAGEVFDVGGSYVFNLRQGRDTIVVYSRTRRPSLHQDVKATGTVSIGYLDGTPRVALFETPSTP